MSEFLSDGVELFAASCPERAGNATHTLFVGDLDARVAAISARGIEPSDHETYGGVRKVIYRDPEGNEIGLGGNPE